ncbi:MAG: hypothetical protein HYX28_00050 [Candidatus Koribacter versatilis]|uniref:Uncharacterized protein n=1 Tax=Candidatus Korobacter versatilis TaxID=658062 RepID=A0A932A7W7_9BACT|nr:hypothetical protein [Candidatus Koribacter versatilis]
MPWKKGQRPKVVKEQEATGSTASLYQEIRQSLGLPYVPVPFQIFAAIPRFLELHWASMRPLVATEEFFALAGRIRADGYTSAHNYFRVPDLCHRVEDLRFSTGARRELTDTVDTLHHANPLVLLLMAAQLQAFDRTVGRPNVATTPAPPLPQRERPTFIDEDHAPTPTRKLYDDIKRTTGLPIVTTGYLAMARWPDFLAAYWRVLKPILESPLYRESASAVSDTAWQLTRELPGEIKLTCDDLTDAGMTDEDVGACVRITELFVKHLGGMVLNVATAKISLEGGNLAAPPMAAQDELPSRAA